jgi:hypothetical protein
MRPTAALCALLLAVAAAASMLPCAAAAGRRRLSAEQAGVEGPLAKPWDKPAQNNKPLIGILAQVGCLTGGELAVTLASLSAHACRATAPPLLSAAHPCVARVQLELHAVQRSCRHMAAASPCPLPPPHIPPAGLPLLPRSQLCGCGVCQVD